jgi:hypothetical protein
MTGSLQMEATRGGRARLSRRLDFLTDENVATRACFDVLTNEVVQSHTYSDFLTSEIVRSQGQKARFCVSATPKRREPKTHFLPVGNFIRNSSFFFLPVGNLTRIHLTIGYPVL